MKRGRGGNDCYHFRAFMTRLVGWVLSRVYLHNSSVHSMTVGVTGFEWVMRV